MKQQHNTFIVITGPSGAGKTTIAKEILQRLPNAARLITTTTREKRPGEQDEVDYIFTSKEIFEKMIAENALFEYAKVYGNYYGSQKDTLKKMFENHSIVVSVVDVEGARTIKEKMSDTITIFIAPHSTAELAARLTARGDTDTTQMEKRIKKAEYEISTAKEFDVIIKNVDGKLEEAVSHTLKYIQSRIKKAEKFSQL